MISTRPAVPGDLSFIRQHAYRLLAFGPPTWRDQQSMTVADQEHLQSALLAQQADIALFIAEDDNKTACGFIHLTMQTDYYTKERHAHLTDIAVIAGAEGKGIGHALLEKAEEWAKQQGSRWITLNVFEGNMRARSVYEKAGYQQEWIKYLKVLY